MPNFIKAGNLSIAENLFQFVNTELLCDAPVTPETFWKGFDEAVHDLAPRNRELLDIRQNMQEQIDQWLRDHADGGYDQKAYEAFLSDIGYLVDEGDDFVVETTNVDDEIARIAGPQLVVPITNARYALNAANARFGSLYDALYGTDVIPMEGETAPQDGFNKTRGDSVIAYVRKFLDQTIPLADGSWKDITNLKIVDGTLSVSHQTGETSLLDAAKFGHQPQRHHWQDRSRRH